MRTFVDNPTVSSIQFSDGNSRKIAARLIETYAKQHKYWVERFEAEEAVRSAAPPLQDTLKDYLGQQEDAANMLIDNPHYQGDGMLPGDPHYHRVAW